MKERYNMSNHVLIWNDGEEDSIISYTKSPAVVVAFDRKDLNNVLHVEQAKIPGIYILVGEQDDVYIGQAAHDITTRMKRHDKEKAFWKSCFLFGREDKQLDKSQLDYLEKTIIERYGSAGYQLVNNTEGNSSVIFPYQKGIAQSLLVQVEDILQNFTDHTLKPSRKSFRYHQVSENSEHSPSKTITKIVDNKGVIINEHSARQAYIKYVEELCTHQECYSFILEESLKESMWIISTQRWDNLPEKSKRYYRKINDQIMLNVNYSRATIQSTLQKLAGIVGREIVFSYE